MKETKALIVTVNEKQQRNKLADLTKLIFACLIPFLHISFSENSIWVLIIQQYFSRLGVPVFFAFSGYYLWKSIGRYGTSMALRKYLGRIGRLYFLWLILYFPLILFSNRNTSPIELIQLILFKTPAYLWYLMASMVAAIPFCLIKHRRILHIGAALFYIVGTLYGGGIFGLLAGANYMKIYFLQLETVYSLHFPCSVWVNLSGGETL